VVATNEPDEALLRWAESVAAAIRTGLGRAAADPAAAVRLTLPASGRRGGGRRGYAAMVEELSARLLDGAPPLRDPERTARNVVVRVARQVLLHLETRPEEPLTEIAPDLIVFVLTPYVGLRTARGLAAG
jgi:hypothetical protein